MYDPALDPRCVCGHSCWLHYGTRTIPCGAIDVIDGERIACQCNEYVCAADSPACYWTRGAGLARCPVHGQSPGDT